MDKYRSKVHLQTLRTLCSFHPIANFKVLVKVKHERNVYISYKIHFLKYVIFF